MTSSNILNKKLNFSIIIINYNLAKEIEDCLNSLIKIADLQKDLDYEVIIVDNNSPDKKLPETENKFSRDNIHFFYLDENVGFGKGCNYGFSKASGEYICFLNPDTIINENIFQPIIKLFETDNTIGIIGPKQQVRSPLFDFSAGFFPNLFFELFSLFGVGVFFEGFIVFILTKINKNKILKVDWILGASIFIKSEIFSAVEGFDKDYFMFYEEVDLCKRVSSTGFKIVYAPQYSIHHIGSVSGKKDYTLYTIRTYSSKYLYISKHYKSVYKILMRSLLFLQSFTQMIIWTILYPVNNEKSKQKINAFVYLIKNNMRLN